MSTGVRVEWSLEDSATSYEIRRADTFVGVQLVVGTVGAGAAFFDDPNGTPTSVYQVLGFDLQGILVADTGLFRIEGALGAAVETRIPVDENYGGPDALRYVVGDAPVANAEIRAFRQPDWLAGRRDIAVAQTLTDATGRFGSPLYLLPGFTYVLVFYKQDVAGPDVKEIVV